LNSPRVLLLGAHPDDAELKSGGTCAKWIKHGFSVLLASVTDGGAGHHILRPPELVERRRAEASAAGSVLGVDSCVLDLPDGALLPTLEARNKILRLIRDFRADLVITHRLTDYHPDHRYTAQLVQDAAYLVTVPAICPKVRHLDRNPVFLYFSDNFTKPYPFKPDVVVDIGPELDRLVSALDCHVSQFYEWLPFNSGTSQQVPLEVHARKAWLAECLRRRIRPLADRFRSRVLQTYGDETGRLVEFIEAFEICEYGAAFDAEAEARLFPFLAAKSTSEDRAALE
jgi:LmbE family N-acetylglucosaminyl deacetylase